MSRSGMMALSFLLAASLVSCGGGGGHSSPTEPAPVYPSVGGAWQGSWSAISVPITVRMDIAQGANGHVTGTFTSLGSVIEVAGDVTPDRSFSWHALGNSGGCAQLNGGGQFNAVQASSYSGTIDLDSRTCGPSGERFLGAVTMSRIGSAEIAAPHGRLEDLTRELEHR